MTSPNKQDVRKILIAHKQGIYRFINFELRPSDGSFYFSIVRSGTNASYAQFTSDTPATDITHVTLEQQRPKTKDVSYHSSGLIHYKNISNPVIYGEPISRITQPFAIGSLSIPSIDKLDTYQEAITDGDAIFAFDDSFNGHVHFSFVIAPWNYLPLEMALSVRYHELFSFNVQVSRTPMQSPEELKDHFIFFTPSTGLFDKQALDKDAALVAFHQKWQNTRGLILYSPNGEGMYKIICAVPMRIPPEVYIAFHDPGLQAEVISRTPSHILFKIKNKHGHYLKKEVGIIGIELNAEL